jgi:hypothetical protein
MFNKESLVMPTKALCQKMVLYVPNPQPYKNGCNKYLKRMLVEIERDVIINTIGSYSNTISSPFHFMLVFFWRYYLKKIATVKFCANILGYELAIQLCFKVADCWLHLVEYKLRKKNMTNTTKFGHAKKTW